MTLISIFSQVSFKPVITQDISLRATSFSPDNLKRCVLKSGDFFQLHIEVSGGAVEWIKDGQIVPKVNQPYCDRDGHLLNVDQPDRTQLLQPGTYPPSRPKQSWHDMNPSKQHFPPNRGHSFLGGRCQVDIDFFFFQKNYCSSILKKNYLQEKDRGTYQARVVSKAGECYSSLITIEVEPGPEWEGVTNGWIGSKKQNKPCLCVSDHYGAEMATVAADSVNEGAQHRLMLGLSHSYGSSIIPTGWIRGTVGSWEIKKSLEEREVVEREGKAAKLAESERKKLFEWLLQQPFAETQEDIEQRRRDSMQFAVSEAVRNTLFRIWVEQDMTLHIQLEANYDALCQYLSDANDWPSQPLKKSVEKLLVGTTLNHTWETHLEYEQELAEGWAESFDLIRATWTIR